MSQPQQMSYGQATKTVRDYVCSKCRGHLNLVHVKNEIDLCEVSCHNPACDGSGFVTKEFVRIRKEQDHFDFVDAYANLGKLLGVREESCEQGLKELGF